MHSERTELENLAGTHGGTEADLIDQYEAWAATVGVIDWADLETQLPASWGIDDLHG
jgi:hypothetical protein